MKFPIQSQRGAAPHPIEIPWSVAELAYSVYSSRYGRGQSLKRLAERGGFGPNEMDDFLPDWRERCSEIVALQSRIDALEMELATSKRFKAFVHEYLDAHGVPHGDPNNRHQKEGCRIGARLDLLLAQRQS